MLRKKLNQARDDTFRIWEKIFFCAEVNKMLFLLHHRIH